MLLEQSISNLKRFREQIYSAIKYRADACMELLDSLCSNITADTPVKLSLNRHHNRTYNSITDVISEFHNGGNTQDENLTDCVLQQLAISNQDRNYYLFVTDCTPAPRVHSPTLSDRGIVYSPNPVTGNKPITIGHKYSIMGFLPPKTNKAPPWILPLMTQRVSTDSKDTEIGAEQLQETLNKLNCELLCVR